MLAMLHSLAAERSEREAWWIHGARNRAQHSFHDEAEGLLEKLRTPTGSSPTAPDPTIAAVATST